MSARLPESQAATTSAPSVTSATPSTMARWRRLLPTEVARSGEAGCSAVAGGGGPFIAPDCRRSPPRASWVPCRTTATAPSSSPCLASSSGGATLHPGPGLREICGEHSGAGKQLEPPGQGCQVQEARIDEHADEIVVLLAPCGELGGGEVMA